MKKDLEATCIMSGSGLRGQGCYFSNGESNAKFLVTGVEMLKVSKTFFDAKTLKQSQAHVRQQYRKT